MGRYGYEGSETFRPLTPWAYFGYSILFSLPVLGLIFLIVFSVSDKNINRRSYARSIWCAVLIGSILLFVFGVLFALFGVELMRAGDMEEAIRELQSLIPRY